MFTFVAVYKCSCLHLKLFTLVAV